MTEVLDKLDTYTINKLKEAIGRHNLIIIPTETVYGIAADATDSLAVKKIFEAKNRPADNPLIIHFYNKQHVLEYVDLTFTVLEERIINELMPGSITLLKDFNGTRVSPSAVCNKMSICIRIPRNDLTRELIYNIGKPLAAPSANKSGKPSCTTAVDCLNEFKNNSEVEYILNGGPCEHGLESTIIRVDDDTIKILRKGAVTSEDIKQRLNDCKVEYSSPNTETIIPGTKYKHYSPNAEVYVVKANETESIENKLDRIKTKAQNKRILMCVYEDYFNKNESTEPSTDFSDLVFQACRIGNVFLLNLGNKNNLKNVGKYLYKVLRVADEQKITEVYFEFVENEGLGTTIAERLSKASNNKTI